MLESNAHILDIGVLSTTQYILRKLISSSSYITWAKTDLLDLFEGGEAMYVLPLSLS